MITAATKANAISLIKLGDSPERVSEELELPLMLVREWASTLDDSDLTRMQANANALTKVVNGELMPSTPEKIEQLRAKIEEVAVEIIDEVSKNVVFGDVFQAKKLNLLADTCSKLYMTVINKGKANSEPQTPGQAALTMFEQLRKD